MPKTTALLACIFTLFLQAKLFGENKQKDYEAAARRASETTDIFSSNPLLVDARFHINVLGGQTEGKYRYMKLSKEEYREELETSGFSESVVHNSGGRYATRSRELEPLPLWYLRELIYLAHAVLPSAPVSKVTTSLQNGRSVRCFGLERGAYSEYWQHQTCFDVDTGVLTSFEYRFNSDVHRLEYSKFREQDNKGYPTAMRRYHNGTLLAEVEVDSITHAPMDQKLFDAPKNAVLQELCKTFKPAEAEYSKEYFQIRSDHRAGSVVIAGSLDDRGKVRESEIQQSAGPKMDAAALKALKEVHIHPARCGGHPIPSLFRLQIWFSPALHPDEFQSFQW